MRPVPALHRHDRIPRRRPGAGCAGTVREVPAEWAAAATRPGKRVLVIAGPNGAGKTTFARAFLPRGGDSPAFVNADLIAAGIAPFAPDAAAVRAGRIMLSEIRRHARRGESFAFETTLAGRSWARHVPVWRAKGYRVILAFLALASPELAVRRVALRVRQGGHDVPAPVIRRRFRAGRANLDAVYRPLVDAWYLYDNSGPAPVLLAHGARP